MRVACYNCLKSYGNQRDHVLLDRHDAKKILELINTGGDIDADSQHGQGTELRSYSKVPEDNVRAQVTTSRGIERGYFRILLWTNEGVRVGLKAKKIDPPGPEISISNQELDSGTGKIVVFFNP